MPFHNEYSYFGTYFVQYFNITYHVILFSDDLIIARVDFNITFMRDHTFLKALYLLDGSHFFYYATFRFSLDYLIGDSLSLLFHPCYFSM